MESDQLRLLLDDLVRSVQLLQYQTEQLCVLIPSATLAGAAAPSLPRGQLLPGAPGPAGLRLQPEQPQSQASSSGCFPFEQQQADALMTSLPLQPPVQPRRQPALTTSSPSELTWEQWRASLPDNGPMTEYRHGVHYCCFCDGSIRGDFEAHVGSKKHLGKLYWCWKTSGNYEHVVWPTFQSGACTLLPADEPRWPWLAGQR